MPALDRVETQLPGGPPAGPPAARPDGAPAGGLFADTRRVGLLAFLGTVTMLFVGFTSAYVLRRASPDWAPLQFPSLL